MSPQASMSKNKNRHKAVTAGREATIQHLLGDEMCKRAAAGSHFPSINMADMPLSKIHRKAPENTQMWGVMCFGHGG